MTHVDLILYPQWIIPVEPYTAVLENHAIIVHQGKIYDLLPKKQAETKYQSSTQLTLPNHIILPGIINAHTHSPMSLFRGLADDLPLMEWLNNHMWPAEKAWLSKSFIEDGTYLSLAEMIKSGTTCFNEHYFFPEVIAEVTAKTGLRARIGLPIINVETAWAKDENDCLEKGLEILRQDSHFPLIKFSLAPHAPYTTSDAILQEINKISKEQQLPIHMHVHETAHEIQESLKQYHKRPLKRLFDLGILSSLFQNVHMTQVNEEDIEILKSTKAHVISCPESNLKLASGFCPVQTLLDNNINVGLGTDSAVSNNDLDMFGEMRTAALLGKAVSQNATATSAATTLQMATLNNAKALGLDHEIGSIKVGKAADMIAIDLHDLATLPLYNPISQLVYSTNRCQITDVWVAGKQLLKQGKLTTIDEESILEKTKEWGQKISKKLQ